MRLRTLLFVALLVLPLVTSDAQPIYGPFNNCSGTVGASPAQLVFTPSFAGGPTAPVYFLYLQNNSTSNQVLWYTPLPSGTAVTAAPSGQLVATAAIAFDSTSSPVPGAVSVVGSAATTVYTCWYR